MTTTTTPTTPLPATGKPPWTIRARQLLGLSWVNWRQHRLGVGVLAAIYLGISVWFLLTGLPMHRTFTGLGLDTCGDLDGGGCQAGLTQFVHQYASQVTNAAPLLLAIPGLIGVFIGAPLVAREFEAGTYSFAWTQGRTRLQWITAKLVTLGVVLALLSLGFSAMYSWWYGPFDAIRGRMEPGGAYEISGLVFTARALFSFTLGAALGAVIRRTVPAMLATAAVWPALVLPSVIYLRPLIQPPITARGQAPETSWVVDQWIQEPSGRRTTLADVIQQIIGTHPHAGKVSPQTINHWLSQHHYTQWFTYQPDLRFWHFQLTEASAYTLIALLLAILTVIWLRRRAA